MSLEDNKNLVRRMFEEVYDKRNYDFADECYATDYISHNGLSLEVTGPADIKRGAALQHQAFPDLQMTIDDLIAEGDRVVVRGTDRGTHQGENMGYAPTGKPFTFTWIDIFRIENGKLKESWLEINVEAIHRQLSGA